MRVLRVMSCAMLYGVYCSCVCLCLGLITCLRDVFVIHGVLLYGLCLCCFVVVRVGLNMFGCFVRDALSVVWFAVLVCVCVCVRYCL